MFNGVVIKYIYIYKKRDTDLGDAIPGFAGKAPFPALVLVWELRGQQVMPHPQGSTQGARSSYLSIDALQELQLLPQEAHSHLQLLLGQVETVHVLERHHVCSEKG